MLDMFVSLWGGIEDDDDFQEEVPKDGLENTQNECGDRLGKKEICQDIFLLASIGCLITCASIRGCQEIKKHRAVSAEKAKVIQIQNQR